LTRLLGAVSIFDKNKIPETRRSRLTIGADMACVRSGMFENTTQN
jgi:hypothetical protein